MRTRLLVALLAASVALAACGGNDDGSAAAPSNATGADLDFSALSVGGESVDASDYAGSDLVIWFWAPW